MKTCSCVAKEMTIKSSKFSYGFSMLHSSTSVNKSMMMMCKPQALCEDNNNQSGCSPNMRVFDGYFLYVRTLDLTGGIALPLLFIIDRVSISLQTITTHQQILCMRKWRITLDIRLNSRTLLQN